MGISCYNQIIAVWTMSSDEKEAKLIPDWVGCNFLGKNAFSLKHDLSECFIYEKYIPWVPGIRFYQVHKYIRWLSLSF